METGGVDREVVEFENLNGFAGLRAKPFAHNKPNGHLPIGVAATSAAGSPVMGEWSPR